MAYPVIVASFLGISSELTCTSKVLYLRSQGVAVVKAVREHLAYGSMSIDSCCAATTNVRREGRGVAEGANWYGAVIRNRAKEKVENSMFKLG